MGGKRKPRLDVKIPRPYGITRRIAIEFEKKCEELGLPKSNVVESLMEQFLNDMKNATKK